MTALRYALGAVAGCAAPLWCRVVGHQLYTTQWADYPWRLEYCGRCGDEWHEEARRRV